MLARIGLSSGRIIELMKLEIFSTYGGFLEGYPCAPVNDRLLASLGKPQGDLPVLLITPPRRYPEPMTRYGFGPVEELPAVYCRGSFCSERMDERLDSALYRSGLAVIWFQDDLADPVAESVTAAVTGVAWEELARDLEL